MQSVNRRTARPVGRKKQDKHTRAIFRLLKAAFPLVPDEIEQSVYRYNPVAIRVRVIDPRFEDRSYLERQAIVEREALHALPEDVQGDITMLLMFTPEEYAEPPLMSRIFDDPEDRRL